MMTSIKLNKVAGVTFVAGACFLFLSRSAAPRVNPRRKLRALALGAFNDPKSTEVQDDKGVVSPILDDPIPLHMIQIGSPRTATTYQQHIVCLSLFTKLLESPTYEHPVLGTLDTADMLQKMTCTNNKQHAEYHPPDQPLVLKTHTPTMVLEQIDLEDKTPLWVFRSTSHGQKSFANKGRTELDEKGYPNTKVIQYVEDLKERGHATVEDYQQIFRLTDIHVKELFEYIEPWDVLRQCCGKQMSGSWRNEMLPDWSPNKSTDNLSEPHTCSEYDIDEVERAFIASALYTRIVTMAGRGMDHASRPSAQDGVLDGSYCSTYNEKIKTKGIGFNQG